MNKKDDELKKLIRLTNDLIKYKFGEDSDVHISCSYGTINEDNENEEEDYDDEDEYDEIEEAIFNERIRIAKKMLKMKYSVNEISKITELSPKIIRKIN